MMTIKTIEKTLNNLQNQVDKQTQDFQDKLDNLQNQVDKLISERTVKKQKNIQPEP